MVARGRAPLAPTYKTHGQLLEAIKIIKLFKKLFGRSKQQYPEPIIIPRTEHCISRANISPNALKVLYRLSEAGFSAYLVGGGVRDLLLGHIPKDFDIATDARPEQIKKLFRNCLLIGRRFRLAHVRFGREIVEVATFRAAETHKKSKHRHKAEHGMLMRDNVYGSLEEDAWRRDFTVNALYYNIADFSVVDYCNGMQDLQQKTLRIIGDPAQRFREDPVRLLRTIRFAGKLGLTIHPDTEILIIKLAPLLQHVPPARLFEEVLKLFHGGKALVTFDLLRHYQLFQPLFPQTANCFTQSPYAAQAETLLRAACANTDTRILSHKTVSPAFLFASLLWYCRIELAEQFMAQEEPLPVAIDRASYEILREQAKHLSVPRRFTQMVREIWDLQRYLEQRQVKYIWRLLEHPRFRAAYDFLILRTEAGEPLNELVEWWTTFQDSDSPQRQAMLEALPKKPKRKKFKNPSPAATRRPLPQGER
jgi:poly(A) polymerase